MSDTLTPQTKWENYSFDDIVELAEDDDIIITNKGELLTYLNDRNDNYYKVLDNGTYDILFG